MNHRITLMRLNSGQDAAGQPVTDWQDVATVWADARFQTGVEVLRAGGEVALARASIRIRTRTDVTAAWRVRYQGAEYEVKAPPLPDTDRQFMFLIVEGVK